MTRTVAHVSGEDLLSLKANNMCRQLGEDWYYHRPLSSGKGYNIKCENTMHNFSNHQLHIWERIARSTGAREINIVSKPDCVSMTVGDCRLQNNQSSRASFFIVLVVIVFIGITYKFSDFTTLRKLLHNSSYFNV